MPNYDVTVNRWLGDGFEKPSITCAVCHKPATVVEINGDRVCGHCLDEAGRRINAAVMEAVWLPDNKV